MAEVGGYVDARVLLAEALQAFLPPEPIGVAEWAGKYRWLTNEGGGHVGLWDNERAPYLVEPMEALGSERYLTVAVAGPGQSGKTSLGDNWMLQSIDADPANMLRYMQTKDAVEAYVKRTVEPMLAAHGQVKAKQGLRPIDDSLGFKRFRGMSVDFLVAARSNLISKDAPRIIADEIDAWDPGFGDPMVQLDVRRSTYGSDSMVLAISHPDRARGVEPSDWIAGIMAVYRDSTRCTWWWPCPECDGWSSPNPGTARQCVLVYPEDAPIEEIAAQTFLLCPCCGTLIRDDHRSEMNRRGRWVGQGEEIDEAGTMTGSRVRSTTAGYWIVGMMSPFLLEGIGGLAVNRVKAERERDAGGEDRTLREVMTKQWGMPYQPTRQVGSLDAETLADRAEPGLHIGMVPDGVRFLTAAIDCQNDRFEAMVRGWGVDGESWIVAHWIVRADPATSPGDWDDLIRDVLARRWPLADGSGRTMRVFAAGYDSQGQAGVTMQAFSAWQRAQATGYAKRAGIVDGREAWTLLPLRGASGNNPAPIVVTRPDSQWRKDRATSTRGIVPLGIFAPNRFKDDAAAQLSVAAPGPWHVHIPTGFRGDYPAEPRRDAKPHLFLGQLTAERRNARGAWAKLTSASRNEAWDLLVMTHVMAHLHGLARMDWDSPPGWAATWDENPFVEPGDGDDPPRPQGKGSAPGPARAVPAAPARRVIRSNFMRR
jgi:phage terminase large subunit GpA-like protein